MIIEHILSDSSENVQLCGAHRIFCIDCSGSMTSSLNELRTQLKNKISRMIQPDDFFTLVWFSGKGEVGTIFEHISISDLSDLQAIHQTIDRYVKSVGLTGFVEPIRLCKKLAEKYTETPQVFFLTDGGENSWSKDECEKAFSEMKGISTVIVEYQYYCDRVFLKRLAEISEAVSVFNETFESFDTTFDMYMKNKVSNSRKFETNLPILYFDEETLVIRNEAPNGFIAIPQHIQKVWQLDPAPFVFESEERDKLSEKVKHVYISMLYAIHTKSKGMMNHCVSVLGDRYISKLYSTCFSKQDYSNLVSYLTKCVSDPETYAFRDGVDFTCQADDIFNVVDLLKLISNDEKARFYPYQMKYSRISKEAKKDTSFVPNTSLGSKFTLVYNQSRANVSMGCQVYGHSVDENEDIQPVNAYRNYTVLKDGIKNITVMPLSFSQETHARLVKEKCVPVSDYEKGRVYMVDVTELPVVNRKFVESPMTSDEFCGHHIELYRLKANIKYLKKMIEIDEKKDDDAEEKVEKRDYAKKDPNAVRDFYVAPELQVKISKCSTIPTINQKLLDKLSQNSKLTVSESVLLPIHKECSEYVLENKLDWLKSKMEEYKKRADELTSLLEQMKMALLIGGVWFSDCSGDKKTFQVGGFEVIVEVNDVNVYMD
jgi:hypothetical protein